MEPIIEVKGIGKKYEIAHERGRYVALRDVLTNAIKTPFALIKTKVKHATGLEKKEDYWALRDINFKVNKGEVIGIIGRNGAGKSTLLKILSQITPPTTGEITIRGRVGSLLEVGTGFHPELTGRENIFLNGAILGMTRREITKKFDEIVTFAGIEKFLDTPVKYYSSGMYVRLAFSVAAHMEPDILIVDEVLAVGDAEFQKKCLGKMDEITKKEGRTILFVSHNLSSIKLLCNKCILLDNGVLLNMGKTEEIIEKYISTSKNKSKTDLPIDRGDLIVANFDISQSNNKPDEFDGGVPIDISVVFELKHEIRNFRIGFCVRNSMDEIVFRSLLADWDATNETLAKGKYTASCKIPAHFLNYNDYFIELYSTIYNDKNYEVGNPTKTLIKIRKPNTYNIAHPDEPPQGNVILQPTWMIKKIS